MSTVNWDIIITEIREAAKDERGIKIAEHMSDIQMRTYWGAEHLTTYCRSDDLQYLLDVEEELMNVIALANKALACCKKEINTTEARELPESAEARDD